jgi:regulator of sirC expression with transglutaminase-like and TPR domain
MILMRMLRNLKGLYLEQGDWERVARSADRLLKLSPDTAEALRDRGLAYRELGYAKGAREDLARYLQLLPEADDLEAVRSTLIDLGTGANRVN